ncbi:MAG: bifunctional serine/threonine-protein kinase/formylglycine-generating enzyme family protein [Planctomycetota bacterium]
MGPDGEALYDQFLDAWLAGAGEEPEQFFTRHPQLDQKGRERIRQLHAVLTQTGEPDRERLPFDKLGGYRLLRRIGGGGMGAVFLAEQQSLRRLVALKVIRPELQTSRTALKRFLREATAVARLRHPNVVRVYELGEEQGTHFIAMEYVPGRLLSELVAEERPVLSRTLRWVSELADALHETHRHGVVHRDVKPGNILITPDERAVLLDFGMAHLKETQATRLTRTFAGSPSYAAPEQLAEGVPVDGRTDVYALGATLYECLTGRPPFDGDSVEAILSKVMREEPVAPTRLDATIPSDVETVTLKALAKRPVDRYASAESFRGDLSALREARRITAKRPSLLLRLRMKARAHPVRAAAIGTACAGLLVLVGVILIQARARELERRRQANEAVADAGRLVTRYREDRIRSTELMRRFNVLQDRTEDSYLTDEQDGELESVLTQVDTLRRRREAAFHEVLALLRRAQRLDPGVAGTVEVRGRLYLEKFEEAWNAEDWVAAEFYRDLVAETDPDGRLTEEWRRPAAVTIQAAEGTAAYLFRDQELHRRFVPVPEPGQPHPLLLRGDWALRVQRGAGEIEAGDVILGIDGGPVREAIGWADKSARVFRMGREFEATLPANLVVRRTAAPLLPHPGCRVEPDVLKLAPGTVRFLFKRPGYEDLVLAAQLAPGSSTSLVVEQLKEGTTPAGFVYIGRDAVNQLPYWIQEREVTCAEYLAFLNAPDTITEIERANRLIRVPRGPDSLAAGGDWPRDESGFRIAASWRPDWPVIGISYEDAEAYARWLSRRDRRTYTLPNRHEWTNAAGVWLKRPFVFGRFWRPKWVSSCYAKPRPAPESVLSYPIDESVYGVFDLTGSVAEWLDDWFDTGRTTKRFGGSSWGHAKSELFRIWGGMPGAKPGSVSHSYGFRLVIRR